MEILANLKRSKHIKLSLKLEKISINGKLGWIRREKIK
jgi:hypothetical protein